MRTRTALRPLLSIALDGIVTHAHVTMQPGRSPAT